MIKNEKLKSFDDAILILKRTHDEKSRTRKFQNTFSNQAKIVIRGNQRTLLEIRIG